MRERRRRGGTNLELSLGSISKSLSTLRFDTETDTDLELIKEFQLAGQSIPAIILSLPPDTGMLLMPDYEEYAKEFRSS